MNYGGATGGLASTGLTVTVAGVHYGTPLVLAIGIGLTALGAVILRLGHRRGKTVGER